MCDVGRLHNRAGLPEGGQWDGCHPPAPSPLGDDHHTTIQLSGPLNHRCKHTYITRTNTRVCTCTHRDVREHTGTHVLMCILCRKRKLHEHTDTKTLICTCFSHLWIRVCAFLRKHVNMSICKSTQSRFQEICCLSQLIDLSHRKDAITSGVVYVCMCRHGAWVCILSHIPTCLRDLYALSVHVTGARSAANIVISAVSAQPWT